jgi:3-oxoacyl-(acyl-carrier-protein) synthase
LIEHQGFDRVIVLGFEDQVNNMTLKFIGEAKACLTYENELQDGVMPSAFDSKNYGFYVGQGAVLAVFESEKIAKTAHARLVGAASASESYSNPIGQRDDGQGFSKAITFSLHQEKTEKAKIKIIKTHGTGTKSNNQSEKNGILNVFDHDFVATSFKPTIGHTMGASGLLESLLLIDNLKKGVVPAIPNRSENDDVFLSHDCQTDEGMFLSLAAGMGNIYSAAIFDARM